MSLETSCKVLKVTGILSLIGGIVAIVFGIMAFAGGTLMEMEGSQVVDGEVTVGALAIGGGVLACVSGVIALLEGIFSIRAANNNEKIMPAWVFAILGLISSIGSLVTSIMSKEDFVSPITTLSVSILVFIAANTIRNANKE